MHIILNSNPSLKKSILLKNQAEKTILLFDNWFNAAFISPGSSSRCYWESIIHRHTWFIIYRCLAEIYFII